MARHRRRRSQKHAPQQQSAPRISAMVQQAPQRRDKAAPCAQHPRLRSLPLSPSRPRTAPRMAPALLEPRCRRQLLRRQALRASLRQPTAQRQARRQTRWPPGALRRAQVVAVSACYPRKTSCACAPYAHVPCAQTMFDLSPACRSAAVPRAPQCSNIAVQQLLSCHAGFIETLNW